jgi:integrase
MHKAENSDGQKQFADRQSSDQRRRVPKYSLHKASGKAVVRINGKDHYLGPYGSPESREAYQRLIAEWNSCLAEQRSEFQNQESVTDLVLNNGNLTIVEVISLYWNFAQTYYVRDGKPTSELEGMKSALKPLKELYGRTLASKFGPLSLKAVRQQMIDSQLCRNEVNKRVGRIKRFFRWAISEELVAPIVIQGLNTVQGLRRGRTEAKESPRVKPVPEDVIHRTVPYMLKPVRAMVLMQLYTGMRPGEVVLMRPCDIDQTENVWVYTPERHKNDWREQRREIPLGPKTKSILAEFMDRPADDYLFKPEEATSEKSQRQFTEHRHLRTTKIYPCEERAKQKRKEKRENTIKRSFCSHYDPNSYRRAIVYGIQRAQKFGEQIPHWHPHQIRHTRATEVRRLYGLEASQACLGHARADVTEIYAEKNQQLAIKVAAQIG